LSDPGTSLTEVEEHERRASLFASGPPRIPRKTIWITLAFAAVFGIGGAFADHSFNVQPAASPTPVTHAGSEHQTLAQFVGLKPLTARIAPAISLTDQNDDAFSLAQDLGRPTLLTFLGTPCSELCPVIVQEIHQAEIDLRRAHLSIAVTIVNANPQQLSPRAVSAAYGKGPLTTLQDASFLTGTLAQLEPVWKDYDVTIDLDPTTHALAYTSVIYLITPSGKLHDALTPFADESFTGSASLPQEEINRFGSGIATYVMGMTR